MGQILLAQIEHQSDLSLSGLWQRGEDLEALLSTASVLLDFSLPEANATVVEAAVTRRVALVCGVSGLDESQLQRIRVASSKIPIVYDRNMSMGIAVLQRSVRAAAMSLGDSFEISISDVHHVHKIDTPSGTALQLAEVVAEAAGKSGTQGVRFSSERRGEVPGDHHVIMRSETESLTFSHSVTTRQVFADGALRAARWLHDHEPGLFSMQDVLFD